MGLKAAVLCAFALSVFSSTSFAVEVSIPVKKSCAGKAEPNFFHLDKSGFEGLEMSLQETEYGPSLQLGNDVSIFLGGGADVSQDANASKKNISWCGISKNPKKINPKSSGEPNKPDCGLFSTKSGQASSSGRVVNEPLPVTVNGQQFMIQTEYTRDPSSSKITDSKMWIYKNGEPTRLLLNPEVSKNGNKKKSKLTVDALHNGKIVGRTESSIEGTVDEQQDSNKFLTCKNLLATNKKASASDYRVPKNTKDLNGDHHPVGSRLGYNDQFKPQNYEDVYGQAAYRQKTDGTPVVALGSGRN